MSELLRTEKIFIESHHRDVSCFKTDISRELVPVTEFTIRRYCQGTCTSPCYMGNLVNRFFIMYIE